MTASIAAAKELNMDAAVTVLFELGGFFTLKKEQRTAVKALFTPNWLLGGFS